ncbi:CLIP-associated protein-like isoform X3 [Dioscorea cayenensis subsp. rotundata]|uniref:CLIP-associated protein-like isoform X3 n=1 Tax=Dioscorea cayennensis subsp. rotundata TaxID=55577 RepID=A0AB40AP14_DIOCR|nr:CLIP-associated protein-like isoform X3 [Dioscorea cayenensis subsp. rotundata]
MEEVLEMARVKDTKERMAAVERLHQYLESSRKHLSSAEVTALVDCCLDLFKDHNFRVSQGALQALSSAAVLSGEHLKIHFNGLVPAVVERLGDGKQPVRDAARQLFITLMEISSPTFIVERAGSYAWTHKSWRVREEFARTVAAAVGLFVSTELTLQRVLLPPVLQLLDDSNNSVRESATTCLEEMYMHIGPQFYDELQRYYLPPSMMKEINAKLERLEPKARQSDGLGSNFITAEMKSSSISHKRTSPKSKSAPKEPLFSTAESNVAEKHVDPIKVYSEKVLVKEIEKIASILVPEKDWSVRITAMQRVEGLVFGGAADYPSFPMLLKQLVTPLSTQLSDRRSSIVKQACHLLNLLSKELLGGFEACAEMFIPVLLKLVVITVLVISESADNCIKTMIHNCKVARILPRIADYAKNDRSAVLRVRCCEYAHLMLDYWADASDIQRSADLYEDLLKCCVADAMCEVRATARACYCLFSKTWPERSHRLFLSFDPVIQRIINDGDGNVHKRYASPSLRERGVQVPCAQAYAVPPSVPGYGTSAIVAMDKSTSTHSGSTVSFSSVLLAQTKPFSNSSERNLESVLDASKQKVSAIENLLRGVNLAGRQNSSVAHSSGLNLANITGGGIRNRSSLTDLVNPQIQASRDLSKTYLSHIASDSLSTVSSPYTARRFSERLQEGGKLEDISDNRSIRALTFSLPEKQYFGAPYRDAGYMDSHNNHIPNFQRPLLRKQVTSRASGSGRNSSDDCQLALGDTTGMNGPASLNDALAEGLCPRSDWIARVSAFNYIRTFLHQDPKGIQEIAQSFEKIMKLFFQHLDDPHHKVAQAALLTLAEIIPTCRKLFESYLERTLPHVFSRLIDPKELVRQPCSTTLEIVGKTYGIEFLLPALVRSLDEQRSPKAKLAVIEFANNSFGKHSINSDGYSNNSFLKLWLAKLSPLVNDKNTKLKEAAISAIISVYSHFDPVSVLNFILSLAVEKQNSLRRALKQYTPRIEVELINFLQNKKERQRSKLLYDQSDTVGTSSEEGYAGILKKSLLFGRYSSGSVDGEGGRKWSGTQEINQLSVAIAQAASDETVQCLYQHFEASSDSEGRGFRNKGLNCNINTDLESVGSLINYSENADKNVVNNVDQKVLGTLVVHSINEGELTEEKLSSVNRHSIADNELSIPQLLHQVCNGTDSTSSYPTGEALQQLVKASLVNDHSIWTKYFNQILTSVLEVLDDSNPSTRELALSLITELLNNQKELMEDSIEIVIEKLFHATKDMVAEVSNEAHNCLTTLLGHYDPFRCLMVIVPLLVSDDERTLVICINCLTKLVGRLSQGELMMQLPSFLPALVDAFRNQSPDVRKTVVFCLVDIYIMLGKAFLPYLQGLSSTQLRLVTIYANRISQARSGAPTDINH